MLFRIVLNPQSGINLNVSLRPPHFQRPQGPRTRSLMVLQTHALNSSIGMGHHSASRLGLQCPYNLTLTAGLTLSARR